MSKIYKGEDVKNNILLGMEVLVSFHSHKIPSGRNTIRGIITSISFKNNAFKVSDRVWFVFNAEDLIVEVLSKDEMTDKITYDVLNPEKTWDNLEIDDVLIDERGNERFVLGICGKAIFVSSENVRNYYGGFAKEEFVDEGWKIKGASEDKPDLDAVISWLEKVKATAITSERTDIADTAIEMLKKLK